MSGRTNGDSPNRSKTLIAAGMRIDGKLDFTGTLVVRGEIHGDVSSPDDAAGVLVVDPTGSATGTLAVPRMVVRGRVAGPMRSSQSIEIHAGGSAVGDVRYGALAVQPGGVVDGLLTHAPSAANPHLPSAADRHAQPGAAAHTGIAAGSDAPAAAATATAERPRGRGRLVGIIALLAGLPFVVWLTQRQPEPQTVAGSSPATVVVPPPAPERASGEAIPARPVAEIPESRDRPAPVPSARGGNQPRQSATSAATSAPAAAASNAAAAASGKPTATSADARSEEAPPERPEPDVAQAVAFSGNNPARPAGLLFVVTRAPAVVYKKKSDDRSRGTRLALGSNRNTSIRVSPEEVVRVAEGTAIDLYYQGVRVPAQTVASGAWMRFVPLPPPAPREGEDAARPATAGPAEQAAQPPGGTGEVRSADRAL